MPALTADEPGEEDIDQAAANGIEIGAPLRLNGLAGGLSEEDRDKLGGVLRELLEMKRMLDRARE